MSGNIIQTQNAPAAIGPYSQAVAAGGFLFTSGQLGMDPGSGMLAQGIEAQAKQSLSNIQAILEAAGFGKNDVVKTVIYLKDLADFATVNEIYAGFFGSHRPARSCVEAAGLPKGGLVEIEVVAYHGKDRDAL